MASDRSSTTSLDPRREEVRPPRTNEVGFRATLEAFEVLVDPDGLLNPKERLKVAERARREYISQRRRGAHIQHARYDTRETTAAARRALLNQWDREVDPLGKLHPAERSRRANAARHAHFIQLGVLGNRTRWGRTAAPAPGRPNAEGAE